MQHTKTFHIPALDCPDELALIERSLRGARGIERLSPDYLARSLRVVFDPAQTNAAAIVQSIQQAGFSAEERAHSSKVDLPPSAAASAGHPLPRTTLAGGLLLIAATVAWLIAGAVARPVAVLAIAAAAVSGIHVASAAWRALRLRALDMNVLMTLAATGAIVIGDVFEAATAMFLFAISLWLERVSLARAESAVRSLVELAPNVAHRLLERGTTTESVVDVNPAELTIGEQILVRPGERIPADGEVLSGQSAVNQAPITGESLPVEKQSGDKIFAGTLNGEGSLVLAVMHTANDTTLAHIARLIDEARAARSPTQRFIDDFARLYTPAVIALALALMIVPSILANWNVSWAMEVGALGWVHRGLVLLVIACPCALVISTPVTIVSGLHQATRNGILVKGGEFLEKSASLRILALDKTGTVTTGAMKVVRVEAFNGSSSDDVLATAAALERHSEHPLALAISTAATERGLATTSTAAAAAIRGLGVRGDLNGETYYLGTARLFSEPQFRLSSNDCEQLENRKQGTLAWLGTVDRLIGVIQLADRPREGTRDAIADLRRLGLERIIMLTGDNSSVAQAVAGDIGISEIQADLMPQDKIDRVRALASEGRTAMVGDGVNDAPALAAADVGIALGGQSSDTALETADVVVMTPDLAKVGQLIRLARRCRRLLKQNIVFALATKLGVLVLAAAGYATMWMAVAADVGASMIVIANGMRMIQRNSRPRPPRD